MSYIFEIAKDGKAVLNKNCVHLIPQLRSLTQPELIFIIMAIDYYSPYAKFPDIERFRKAKIHAFSKQDITPWELKHIQNAMEAYESLQYDRRREIKRTYERKIEILQNNLLNEGSAKKLSETLRSISELQRAIKDLDDDIMQNNSFKAVIQGGSKLSLIEEMQKNRNSFRNLEHPQKIWDPLGELNRQTADEE